MADTEGLTLSEYVRDLLLAAVVPVYAVEFGVAEDLPDVAAALTVWTR